MQILGASLADGPARGYERALRLRPDCLGRPFVHLDPLRRDDELEPARIEPLGAVEDRDDVRAGRLERARDDLLRRAIAPERVDGNPNGQRL